MSATLSNQAQLRYVVQWFQEWSEMQRGDFLGILIEKCGPGGLVNGLVSSLESLACKDDANKPPSLFECRVKLFREWSNNWTVQEKETLLSSIKNLDSKFAEKYEEKITKGDKKYEEEDEENERGKEEAEVRGQEREDDDNDNDRVEQVLQDKKNENNEEEDRETERKENE